MIISLSVEQIAEIRFTAKKEIVALNRYCNENPKKTCDLQRHSMSVLEEILVRTDPRNI